MGRPAARRGGVPLPRTPGHPSETRFDAPCSGAPGLLREATPGSATPSRSRPGAGSAASEARPVGEGECSCRLGRSRPPGRTRGSVAWPDAATPAHAASARSARCRGGEVRADTGRRRPAANRTSLRQGAAGRSAVQGAFHAGRAAHRSACEARKDARRASQPAPGVIRCRPSTMMPTAATQLPPARKAMGRQPPTPFKNARAAPIISVVAA